MEALAMGRMDGKAQTQNHLAIGRHGVLEGLGFSVKIIMERYFIIQERSCNLKENICVLLLEAQGRSSSPL